MFNYRLQTKLREGNVFTDVCLSTGVDGRGRRRRSRGGRVYVLSGGRVYVQSGGRVYVEGGIGLAVRYRSKGTRVYMSRGKQVQIRDFVKRAVVDPGEPRGARPPPPHPAL